jgi:hypothetical protein
VLVTITKTIGGQDALSLWRAATLIPNLTPDLGVTGSAYPRRTTIDPRWGGWSKHRGGGEGGPQSGKMTSLWSWCGEGRGIKEGDEEGSTRRTRVCWLCDATAGRRRRRRGGGSSHSSSVGGAKVAEVWCPSCRLRGDDARVERLGTSSPVQF